MIVNNSSYLSGVYFIYNNYIYSLLTFGRDCLNISRILDYDMLFGKGNNTFYLPKF